MRQPESYQARRIKIRSLPSHRDVKVGTGGPSRAAAQANLLTALYLISFLDFEFRKVQIQGQQTLAVIDYDEIAFEIQRTGQQYGAGIHCGNGSSSRNSEIQPQVRTRRLAIEDALGTEDVRNRSVGRSGELSRPFALSSDPVQKFLLDLLSFLNLFLLFGIGFGELSSDTEFD